MNMTIQQPRSYPFYMDKPRFPLPISWSPPTFHLPSPHQQQFPLLHPISQPLSPFIHSQQKNSLLKSIPSFSNTRYHHLKKSTSYPNRRRIHRSFDTSTKPHHYSSYTDKYQPFKTKSVSDIEQISQFSSINLPKAHSWHTMTNHRQSNLSVMYAKENGLIPKRHRKKHSSLEKKKKIHLQRRLPSISPKRKSSFNKPRKQFIEIPERGVVRISTLDEMPIINNQIHKRNNSINNDRSSMKGSISNSSKRRIISKGNNSIKNRKIQNNEEIHVDSDNQSSSSSSSNRSCSSLQQRLNGSLRNDPLIIAAMEDYRQLHRTSSQSTLTHHGQSLSRNSLYSYSTFHPSSISSNHSQSSFTSIERSEIRQLIKTIKKKDTQSKNIPLELSETSITINSEPSVSTRRPKKSSITEELDREFNKLRALDPDQELTYVTPSSFCKQKKPVEKSINTIPPLPTLDELLRQVQLRPVDKSEKSIKEKSVDDNYENPLSCIPVPQSSPIPSDEIIIPETKHEYAIPIKKTEGKTLPLISHFQPIHNFKFNKPIPEKRLSRSLSMLNWLHSGLTHPLPTTFQPNSNINYQNEYKPTNVKENIYTSNINDQNEYKPTDVIENIYSSNIDVYVPSSTIDKNEDNSLQIHLDNKTILTDEFYSDYESKQATNSSSILSDLSYLFTRKHKHQNNLYKKNQRCTIM